MIGRVCLTSDDYIPPVPEVFVAPPADAAAPKRNARRPRQSAVSPAAEAPSHEPQLEDSALGPWKSSCHETVARRAVLEGFAAIKHVQRIVLYDLEHKCRVSVTEPPDSFLPDSPELTLMTGDF